MYVLFEMQVLLVDIVVGELIMKSPYRAYAGGNGHDEVRVDLRDARHALAASRHSVVVVVVVVVVVIVIIIIVIVISDSN